MDAKILNKNKQIKPNKGYKIQYIMTKLDLSQTYKVGLALENRLMQYINIWKEKNVMIISTDVENTWLLFMIKNCYNQKPKVTATAGQRIRTKIPCS